jgi:phytoene dehydrogenase-like protein
MAHIVVIGSGMGSLAAAARLATVGHRVTVCERSKTHGGAVGRRERDGFAFDTGPGLLNLPAVYRDLFVKTSRGIRRTTRASGSATVSSGPGRATLESCVDLREVDPAVRHVLADGTAFSLPNATHAGVSSALDTALGAGHGERWTDLLGRARQVWDATRRPLFEEPLGAAAASLGDPYTPPRRGVPRLGRPRRAERSLADVARRELKHPALVAVLEEYALRYGYDPRRAPASLVALPYLEHTFGTWYVMGGMRALADAVFERCEQQKVEFRFGAEAVALLREGGRVAGVVLADGARREELAADIVVAGGPVPGLAAPGFDAAADDTGPGTAPGKGLRSGGAETAGRAAPGPRGGVGRLTVLLALRGARPAGTVHRTIVHTQDREAELAALFGPEPRGTAAARPTFRLLRPDDPSLRPDDAHESAVLTTAVPVGGGIDWGDPAVADARADQLVEAACAAVPDLAGRVLWREVRTPADTERETGSPGGRVPGPSLAGGAGSWLATGNSPGVEGLHLVGGWSHPGGGLPHAGMSGALVAELIGRP